MTPPGQTPRYAARMLESRRDPRQATSIDNPILNSPYAQPDRHYEVGPNGPTGVIKDGRRASESWIPIAVARKGKKGEPVQETIDFDVTGERRERNELINDIRRDVEKWRSDGHYGGVTPITRKLLQHWADTDRENRVIFCQREAAETAIFLAEVAGRHGGHADLRRRLEPENEAHNDGLPRAALKMATGTRQDRRDGDAHRLADHQQGAVATRRALHQAVPRRHAGHHDPRPAPRAAARGCRATTTTCATSSPPTSGWPRARPDRRSPTTTPSCSGRQGDQGRREEHPQAPPEGRSQGRPVQRDAASRW